nr:hypothetical protein [Tanacetum cinerariifolium]
MEEDIFFLESLLSEEPCPIPPMILNQTKPSIQEPEHSFSMGYEHFSTTLVTKEVAGFSTKNLVPIPHECEVTSDNGSESIDPVKDDSLVFTTFSNLLFKNDEINSDELKSHVESNSVEFTSNHDTEVTCRVHQSNGDVVHNQPTSSSSVPLPPLEPPDEELDFEIDFGDEISVVRNTIVEFECIDARMKFDVFNDEIDNYSYFMFDKLFSFLFAKSEDTIFDPGISA